MGNKFNRYYKDAKELFIKNGKTLVEISEMLNISTRTLRLWKKKDENSWDTQRSSFILQKDASGISRIEKIINQKFETLDSDGISANDIKVIRELKALLKEMKSDIDISNAIIIAMAKFSDFIKLEYNDKKDEFALIISKFFEWVIDKY